MNEVVTSAPHEPVTAAPPPPTTRASIEDLVAIALAIALLSAFGELALYAVRKLAFGSTLHMSPSIVWMTPAALLLIVFLAALPVLLLSRALGQPRAIMAVTAIATFLGVAGVMFAFRGFGLWEPSRSSLASNRPPGGTKLPSRICNGCGSPMPDGRSDRQWCSSACRQRARRAAP